MTQAISAPGTLDGCPEMTRSSRHRNKQLRAVTGFCTLHDKRVIPQCVSVGLVCMPVLKDTHTPRRPKGEPVHRCSDGRFFRVYGSPLHGGSLREKPTTPLGMAFSVYLCFLLRTFFSLAGLVPGAPATVPTLRNDLTRAPLRGATHLSYLTYRC